MGEIEGLFKKEKVETIPGGWRESQTGKLLATAAAARWGKSAPSEKTLKNKLKAENPRLKNEEILDLLHLAEQDQEGDIEEIDFNQLCISDEANSQTSHRDSNNPSPINFIAQRTQERLAANKKQPNHQNKGNNANGIGNEYNPPVIKENKYKRIALVKKKFKAERYHGNGEEGYDERVGGKWMGKNMVEVGIDVPIGDSGNQENAIRQLNPRPCHKYVISVVSSEISTS